MIVTVSSGGEGQLSLCPAVERDFIALRMLGPGEPGSRIGNRELTRGADGPLSGSYGDAAEDLEEELGRPSRRHPRP